MVSNNTFDRTICLLLNQHFIDIYKFEVLLEDVPIENSFDDDIETIATCMQLYFLSTYKGV